MAYIVPVRPSTLSQSFDSDYYFLPLQRRLTSRQDRSVVGLSANPGFQDTWRRSSCFNAIFVTRFPKAVRSYVPCAYSYAYKCRLDSSLVCILDYCVAVCHVAVRISNLFEFTINSIHVTIINSI